MFNKHPQHRDSHYPLVVSDPDQDAQSWYMRGYPEISDVSLLSYVL